MRKMTPTTATMANGVYRDPLQTYVEWKHQGNQQKHGPASESSTKQYVNGLTVSNVKVPITQSVQSNARNSVSCFCISSCITNRRDSIALTYHFVFIV